MDIIFWDFLILYQIFFSPQVKRSVIITNKNGICEIPNDLRLRPLRKFGKIRQISKLQRIITQCPVPPQTEPPPLPPDTSRKPPKNRYSTWKPEPAPHTPQSNADPNESPPQTPTHDRRPKRNAHANIVPQCMIDTSNSHLYKTFPKQLQLEIVECVRKCVDRIFQNLQILSPY